jgi:hypothetical protein
MAFFCSLGRNGFEAVSGSRSLRKSWRPSLSVLALGWSLAVVQFAPALGQEKRCECKFADPKWHAFGTKAACSAFLGKGRTSCEIAFGGLGTDLNVARNVLGVSPAYQIQIIEVLRTYLELLGKNNRDALADPDFIRTTLPIFMRGAFLRGPQDATALAESKRLDSVIGEFFDRNAKDVSLVFLGKKGAFSTNVNETKFEVSRTYISVDDPAGYLITTYMPGEQ